MSRAGTGAGEQHGSPPTRSLFPAPPRFPLGLARSALLAVGVLGALYAFGAQERRSFVKLHQMGKLKGDIYVNRAFVVQIRPGLSYESLIVFSTGNFVEVQGSPSEIAARLEG